MSAITEGNSFTQIAKSRTKAAVPVVLPLDTNASDEALIVAIANGDSRAFDLLYARHSTRVYRFALRLVADRSTADDLVNEVFFDVWRKAGAFEARSQVSTWLLGIARHKALDFMRHRRFETIEENMCEILEDTADDPETAMAKKQSRWILSKCLPTLSPKHREVVDLVYYSGKSITEATEILQVSRNTVKTRMHYARQQLAKKLVAEGMHPA